MYLAVGLCWAPCLLLRPPQVQQADEALVLAEPTAARPASVASTLGVRQ